MRRNLYIAIAFVCIGLAAVLLAKHANSSDHALGVNVDPVLTPTPTVTPALSDDEEEEESADDESGDEVDDSDEICDSGLTDEITQSELYLPCDPVNDDSVRAYECDLDGGKFSFTFVTMKPGSQEGDGKPLMILFDGPNEISRIEVPEVYVDPYQFEYKCSGDKIHLEGLWSSRSCCGYETDMKWTGETLKSLKNECVPFNCAKD